MILRCTTECCGSQDALRFRASQRKDSARRVAPTAAHDHDVAGRQLPGRCAVAEQNRLKRLGPGEPLRERRPPRRRQG